MSRDQSHVIGISCRCGLIWSGLDRVHCGSVCHRTFDDIALFDGHRPDGRCLHPRSLGLVETKNHIWYLPTGAVLLEAAG